MTPTAQGTPRLGPNVLRRKGFAGKDLREGRCNSTDNHAPWADRRAGNVGEGSSLSRQLLYAAVDDPSLTSAR
jgi:hypothetical protein